MNRLLLAVLAGLALLVASCGGEVFVAINVPVVRPPSISLIDFSPTSASVGQGQGTVTSNVTIDFSAPDAAVSFLTVSVVDSRGVLISRTVTSLSAFAGFTNGTISFSIDFSTLIVETYTFTAFVTDSLGNVSNPVFGTFRVFG